MRIPFVQQSDQRGDTVVEVLIAIAVISSVLVGAFIVTNRSTRTVRDSEEHSQALQLLQSQVEQLRAYAQSTTYGTMSTTPNFCFKQDGSGPIGVASGTTYGCSPTSPNGAQYGFVITLPTVAPAPNETGTFTLKVQWDSVLGNKGNESLVYKIATLP
jgi:type II secretory pathway pseudopilin PulG